LGFAIPVDLVKRIVPKLINNGRVPSPSVGIVPSDDMIAARLGIEGVAIARRARISRGARGLGSEQFVDWQIWRHDNGRQRSAGS
jgi:S1-C subfamily serine protease